MTVDELLITIKAAHDKDDKERRFQAALQGIDVEENTSEEDEERDVTTLQGFQAAEAGFGIGLGLGYGQVVPPHLMNNG